MEKRHAFLIILHNSFEQAAILLSMLDAKNHDMYVHVDKKAAFSESDKALLIASVRKGKLYFTERINVFWGDVSLIEAELILLKASVPGNYSYYHLISGADIPLVTNSEFDRFFRENEGKEFVKYTSRKMQKKIQQRVRYYWLWQNRIGSIKVAIAQRSIPKILLFFLQRFVVYLQKLLFVDRRKENAQIIFTEGSEWFSITNEFAEYVLQSEAWIRKTFRHTRVCDEVFIHTLLYNSPFYANRYDQEEFSAKPTANMRYLVWGRNGETPYNFRLSDFSEVMNSRCIFARKISSENDCALSRRIKDHLEESSSL